MCKKMCKKLKINFSQYIYFSPQKKQKTPQKIEVFLVKIPQKIPQSLKKMR